MKYLYSVILLIILFNASAQERDEKAIKAEADTYYNDEQYNLAIQYYRELSNLSDQDAEVNYQLAESYRKTFNYEEAETYYLKVYYQSPAQYPLALYYYSLMLKLNGSFVESINGFSKFIALNEDTKTLKELVEQAVVDRAGSEMARSERDKEAGIYRLKQESINTTFNDYAPALRDSITLVITSGRIASNREAIDERYGEGFTDNFYFVKSGDVWQDKTRQSFNSTNSRYNDGSGCFNGKGDKYYFTVCGKDGPHCRIFISTRSNNKWSDPVAVGENVNYKNFETKHPAVSKGGDTLLFSSNRPGGAGNFDIWMSLNSGHDTWGPAMNMGSSINTKLNEIAPAFTTFSNVFFLASDGHQNYGGQDLYMAKRMSNGVMALYNLDYPFNSNKDDCFITFDDNKIYFSSNRDGGMGSFDIYSVKIPSVISFTSRLSLKNKDARGDIKINGRTERINNINLLTARNEDKIEYENLTYVRKKIVDKMIYNQVYNIKDDPSAYSGLTNEEYSLLKKVANTQYKVKELERRYSRTFLSKVALRSGGAQPVSITATLTDSLTGKPLSFRKILLMDEVGEVIKITTTNESGNFRFTGIEPSKSLYLRSEEMAIGNNEKFLVNSLSVVNSETQTDYGVENIYFDFDHYTLRPEAKEVLNDLVGYLIKSPDVQVEIYAYADDLGADEYNFTLTEKRGQAVLHYLTHNGVDQTSLAVVAKGRQKNASTQLDIQRQYNRRVEFYLNGSKIKFNQNSKTYILRKKTDWDAIAVSTGIDKEELKKLNNATTNDLAVSQPIRIPAAAKEISNSLFFTIH